MEKIDFRKHEKDLYQPKTEPSLIEVPTMKYIMVEGKGNPNSPDGEYSKAVALLYALSHSVKACCKSADIPDFYDYVVPPLEGLWWLKEEEDFDFTQKDQFQWISMIRQPDFVTEELFKKAKQAVSKKKPELSVTKASLRTYSEGLCVQCMHIGPFDEEPVTVKKIDTLITTLGRKNGINSLSPEGMLRRHHEIYLNDSRKVNPLKMKTIIRHPVL
jgi:hypothetical protein